MEEVEKIDETTYQIILDEPTFVVSFKMNKEIKKKIDETYKNFSEIVRKSLQEEITESDLQTIIPLKGNSVTTVRMKSTDVAKLDEEAKKFKVSRQDVILAKLAKVIEL